MAVRNWFTLGWDGSGSDANYRYPLVSKGIRRGVAPALIPRFSTGDKSFTGGTPPVEAKGQRTWGGDLQKYFKDTDNLGLREIFNCSTEWRDRVVLSQAWSGTVYNTAVNEVRLAKRPFKDILVAYSVASNAVWTKSGSGAWAAATLPGAWTGATPTGWLSDTIATISGVPYLLLGSNLGHVMKFDGTTWTEVGRPVSGGNDLYSGIYCMAVYDSVLHLGGANSNGAQMGTYDGTTYTSKFQYEDLNGQARVQTMLSRYVDEDNTQSQLHFTTLRSANGYEGQHFMYDGTNLRVLKIWADDAPLCAIEADMVGGRGIFFGMARWGRIWRYTGDYSLVREQHNPDKSYEYGVPQLAVWGKCLVAPLVDITNGLSILRYDGQEWWQDACVGSSYTQEGCGIAVYRQSIFLVHKATGASRIFELQTGSNYPTSGKVVSSLIDGGFREVDKKWTAVRVNHAALGTGESIQVEYALEDGATSRGYVENFDDTIYKDAVNTTGVWDTSNQKIGVHSVAAKTFVGKVAGSTVVNPHKAYSITEVTDPTTQSPATIISNATEFAQGDYDGVEADDASVATHASTVATLDADNNSASAGTKGSGTDTHYFAVTFVAGASRRLVEVHAWMHLNAAGSDTVVVDLLATSGGTPTGSPLASSGAQTVTQTAETEITFTFSTPYLLTSGTTYALAIRRATGSVDLVLDDGAASGSFTMWVTSDSGANWSSQGGNDIRFQAYLGIPGYTAQLYQFDYSTDGTPPAVAAKLIGYGSDSTGAANKGITLYVYNNNSGAWESLGTNSAGDGDSDATKTITGSKTSNVAYYVDGSSKVHLLAVATYVGTGALANRVRTDLCQITQTTVTTLETVRSNEFDQVASGTIATATLTATATANGGTIAYYLSADNGTTWESVSSGVQKTFAAAGNQLKWRVDLTAASATADSPIVTYLTVSYQVAAYVSLGTNTTVGSTETEYAFGASVLGKLINFRITLGGPGTTTPQLYSFSVEFFVAPDVREAFWGTLELRKGFDYSDGEIEARSSSTMYEALLTLLRGKTTPRLVWADGTIVPKVTFLVGSWEGQVTGVPSASDEEGILRVPVALCEVTV